MSILKKRDPKSPSSVHPEQNQHSMKQVAGQLRAGSPRINAEANGSARAFGEDFNLEHSSSDAPTGVVALSASSSALEPSTSRGPLAQDLRPPSCVYLG